MTKKDLQDGDLLISRCGEEFIYFKDSHIAFSTKTPFIAEMRYYNDDLTQNNNHTIIDEVRRSCGYNKIHKRQTIWNRQEETVMTIQEIEEKLGVSNLKIKK